MKPRRSKQSRKRKQQKQESGPFDWSSLKPLVIANAVLAVVVVGVGVAWRLQATSEVLADFACPPMGTAKFELMTDTRLRQTLMADIDRASASPSQFDWYEERVEALSGRGLHGSWSSLSAHEGGDRVVFLQFDGNDTLIQCDTGAVDAL